MTLTEFLTARLDEDERVASSVTIESVTLTPHSVGTYSIEAFGPARVLREVAAKRAIVADHDPARTTYNPDCGGPTSDSPHGCDTLLALAAVYADHPEYDPAWSKKKGTT